MQGKYCIKNLGMSRKCLLDFAEKRYNYFELCWGGKNVINSRK